MTRAADLKRERRRSRSVNTRRCAVPGCRVVMWSPAKVCGPCAADLKRRGMWVCADPEHAGKRVLPSGRFSPDRKSLYGFRGQCRACYNRVSRDLAHGRGGGTLERVRAREIRQQIEAAEADLERDEFHELAVRMLIRRPR